MAHQDTPIDTEITGMASPLPPIRMGSAGAVAFRQSWIG